LTYEGIFELTCEPAGHEHRTALRQLLELYKYDFTDYDPEDVNEEGRYEYRDLDAYWSCSGHYPFLLRADGKLAGFALIRRFAAESERSEPAGHEMVEFFVMKKYRRSGLGSEAAKRLFLRFPGLWKLKIMEENMPALAFWTRAIDGCGAASGLAETREPDWDGPVLIFAVSEGQKKIFL